ncbi:MAG: hypothetical protein OEY38_21585, partial [Gammaproteobacteria bacterium]|nr:hypothetical protein [Gammaproteobacteria bacterium]
MNAAHPNSSQQETKRFPTVPVYSTNAALKFEESETRDNFPTIQVQAAKRIGNGNENGGYKYSWDTNKILIQLTRDELPVFTAVLLGLIHEIRYEYRGRDRNKSFAIFLDNRNSHNEAHYVMELQEKSKRKLVVPIPPA